MNFGPPILFVGPSLAPDVARALLPSATIMGPAAMGDVLTATRRSRPSAIGLVDGLFLSTLSVFHKEILFALDAGCWVLGASSLGALRAAECERYGMIGVGEIYAKVASGEIEDDDEVALTCAGPEHGFIALSHALVSIRSALTDCVAAGLLTASESSGLVDIQRRRWFPDRHLSSVVPDARSIGIPEERCAALSAMVRKGFRDPKEADARLLVEAIRTLPGTPFPHDRRPRTVISNAFATTLALDVTVPSARGEDVSYDDVRRLLCLSDDGFWELLATAKLRVASNEIANWMFGEATIDEMTAGRERLARRLGVQDVDLDSHLASLDVPEPDLLQMVLVETNLMRLESSGLGSMRVAPVVTEMMNLLRFSGRYPSVRDATSITNDAAEAALIDPPLDAAAILATFASLGGTIPFDDLQGFVEANDLGSIAELLVSLSIAVRANHQLLGTAIERPTSDPSFSVVPAPRMTRNFE
jgi:hypothetical protein